LGALLVVAGCTAGEVPDSGAGVGFGDYGDFAAERAQRDAALTGQPIGGPLVATTPEPVTTPGPNPNAVIPTSELAAAGIGASAEAPEGSAVVFPLDPVWR